MTDQPDETVERAKLAMRRMTATQIAQNLAMLTHVVEQNEPTIAVAQAQRHHISDIRDALKWVAAFSTAGLFFTSQLFRVGGQFVPLTEALGLAVGAIAFMMSIIGAGLFLMTVDLPTAGWLRLLVTRVHLDLQAYRSGMQAYAEANTAIAQGDDPAVSAALDRAQVFLDEVQARGAFPLPATSLLRWEKAATWICLGGFAIGVLAVLGDFVAKIPGTR